MIAHPEDMAEDVKRIWRAGGLPPGQSTGFAELDPLYTVALSQWTLVTGLPGSGKSEFLDAVMVNLAKEGGWRFPIYSPENWPLELHIAHIAEKYVGRPFNPGPTQRMTEEELHDALVWMQGKFYFAKPKKPNMECILEEAGKLVSIVGAWKLGVVVDPWNQLEHHRPAGMSETEYVSQTLTWVIEWVRQANCHLWLVAHPAKMQKDKDGSLPAPTPHDVSGSAHFWNKADNCLCVHRKQADGSQAVEVRVQKVRFRHIGRIGIADLIYDKVTGRYFDTPKTKQIPYRADLDG